MSHFFRICRIMSYITNIIKHMITQYFKDILLKKKLRIYHRVACVICFVIKVRTKF